MWRFAFYYSYSRPPVLYTLSLHDALPILLDSVLASTAKRSAAGAIELRTSVRDWADGRPRTLVRSSIADRKSTRLNSSHVSISYAVFCLKKKTHSMATADVTSVSTS